MLFVLFIIVGILLIIFFAFILIGGTASGLRSRKYYNEASDFFLSCADENNPDDGKTPIERIFERKGNLHPKTEEAVNEILREKGYNV